MSGAHFILQPDVDVSRVEKAVVRHACAMRDDLVIVPSEAATTLACPVGSVEFCRAWMRRVGIQEPAPIDYPTCLLEALGRHVIQVSYAQAHHGCWIKPVQTKAWAPHAMDGKAAIEPDDAVWECSPIPPQDFLAEWRIYVLNGQMLGHGRYDDGPDERAAYDISRVLSWIETYTASGEAPAGYALDVAYMADGRTILVEVTDGWAIGYYRGTCSPADYARLLAARWREIISIPSYIERSA